jgi:hypothetical protein
MKNINWTSVEENKDFDQLIPGGYICNVTTVEDKEDKEYIIVFYDIVEGKFKNYFQQLEQAKNFWGGKFIKSYKESALPFFKGFLTAIENSNSGFIANHFDGDIGKLKNKYIGLVLGEEEYISNDGDVKTRLYVAEVRSVNKIKSGDFKMPKLKKLKITTTIGTDAQKEIESACPF